MMMTYPEVVALEAWNFPVELTDRVQVGDEIIIIAQRVDALIQSRHYSRCMFAQLHRLVQFFTLQMLESVEEVKKVLILLEETLRER